MGSHRQLHNKMATREVTKWTKALRNLMSGRQIVNHQRYEQNIAKRTQPPPALPLGVSGHIANNYFYTRDGRREAAPPEAAYQSTQEAITDGATEEAASVPEVKKAPTPGSVHWI